LGLPRQGSCRGGLSLVSRSRRPRNSIVHAPWLMGKDQIAERPYYAYGYSSYPAYYGYYAPRPYYGYYARY
jgi:hypothetical protein